MIDALAYLGIEGPNTEAWIPLAEQVWGAQIAESGPAGSVRVKVDDAEWRIQVDPAAEDKLSYFGWTVNRNEDLDLFADHLTSQGIAFEVGDRDLADQRSVDRLIAFNDPWGFRHEVVWGQWATPHSFRPGRAHRGFVTGQQGLGHVVLMVPDLEEAHRYYVDVFGFRLSDKILVPGGVQAHFFHCNGRHHTIALAAGPPGVAGLHHLMLQTHSIDDVGIAYEAAQNHGTPLANMLGRHTNDMMFSFYHFTPTTFQIEYGCDGVEVDESTWVPQTYNATAIWGHQPHPDAADRPFALLHELAQN